MNPDRRIKLWRVMIWGIRLNIIASLSGFSGGIYFSLKEGITDLNCAILIIGAAAFYGSLSLHHKIVVKLRSAAQS